MARDIEGLIRTGFPTYAWAISNTTFRVAFIFEALAPLLAVEMTRYNIVDRWVETRRLWRDCTET